MTLKRRRHKRLSCPIPGCRNTRQAEHLMCSACWYTVPHPTRSRVWREFKKRPGSQEHRAAIDEALVAAGGRPVD
jgi:hypothetical protein